jgi:hypothetical protein
MPRPQMSDLDFGGVTRILALPDAVLPQQPATLAQVQAQIEGIAWKDSVRVASVANVTAASPGASVDGIALVLNDRVLLKDQTSALENGIYVWNGAAVPMTRAFDANTFNELEAARIDVEEGTQAGSGWRQTQVNGVLGTNNIAFTVVGTAAPAASTATAGVAAIATQAEVDAGAITNKFVTPASLATYSLRLRKFVSNVGDGSATSIPITHNFATIDVQVEIFRISDGATVNCDSIRNTNNQVTLGFSSAPALNTLRVIIIG